MFDTLYFSTKTGQFAFEKGGVLWRRGTLGEVPRPIYRAQILRDAPALHGAFVSLGRQNALLNYGHRDTPLPVGSEVYVGVHTLASDQKLAVVTLHPVLVGHFICYQPDGEGLHFGKAVSPKTVERLRPILEEKLADTVGSLTVRSAAKPSDLEAILAEWRTLSERFWQNQPHEPGIVCHAEIQPWQPLTDQAKLVVCDSQEVADSLPRGKARIDENLSETLAERIQTTLNELSHRERTPEGVCLVWDSTEACTVVDVNTGTYLPNLPPSAAALAANRLAMQALVRGILLRNVRGMVLVDFVSMSKSDGKRFLEEMQTFAAQYDRRIRVVDMTALGLVEITC